MRAEPPREEGGEDNDPRLSGSGPFLSCLYSLLALFSPFYSPSVRYGVESHDSDERPVYYLSISHLCVYAHHWRDGRLLFVMNLYKQLRHQPRPAPGLDVFVRGFRS